MSDVMEFLWQQTAWSWVIGLAVLGFLIPPSLLYVVFLVLSLPLRRQERARLFLDLVESGMKAGHSVEQTIVGLSSSRDRMLGARFHLLAAYLESGVRLEQALECVPRLLPPQINAMLIAGGRIGDLAKVFPACRLQLKDGMSQTRGALNYLLVLTFTVVPLMPLLMIHIERNILPILREMEMEMLGGVPPVSDLMLHWTWVAVAIQAFLMLAVLLLVVCYLGGPRLRVLDGRWMAAAADRLTTWLPWRYKRMQRDFAAMLAVLLDAEVPERIALEMAAGSTANSVFLRRAAAAAQRLEAGAKLTDAVQLMDRSGEFRWRFANASGAGKFRAALAGWIESLDARAFQQEQTAAQLFTTSIVVVNGVIVGLLALSLFSILVTLIEGLLW